MAAARITCGTCCPKPVLVAVSRRHDAVGCHQDRTIEGRKLLLLLPPCIAVVACKVLVLLECRIIMSRKHLRVRVDIHACPLGLLEQLLQILQVMAGNKDARIAANTDIDRGNLRIAIRTCIRSIQECHAINAILAGLKRQCNKIIHCQGIVQRLCERLLNERINLFIVLKKRIRML